MLFLSIHDMPNPELVCVGQKLKELASLPLIFEGCGQLGYSAIGVTISCQFPDWLIKHLIKLPGRNSLDSFSNRCLLLV